MSDQLLTVRDVMRLAAFKDPKAAQRLMQKIGGFQCGRLWRISEAQWQAFIDKKTGAVQSAPGVASRRRAIHPPGSDPRYLVT